MTQNVPKVYVISKYAQGLPANKWFRIDIRVRDSKPTDVMIDGVAFVKKGQK